MTARRSQWLVVGVLASTVVAAGTAAAEPAPEAARPWGATTTVASLTNAGELPRKQAGGLALSEDGRYVAFSSAAPGVVPGDRNSRFDVFVRDRVAQRTTLVSAAMAGGAGNAGSGPTRGSTFADLALARTGQYVAFVSAATDLVAGDTNGWEDVFVRDLRSGLTQLVSVASDGRQADGGSSSPSMSADGRYVAFASDATNLSGKDNDAVRDVFVRDLVAGTTRLVSVSLDDPFPDAASDQPTISGDGRWVAFQSDATNLVTGDRNRLRDVFLRDLSTRTTTQVSVGRRGLSNGPSFGAGVSDDGSLVAFTSEATNVAAGADTGIAQVFVRDRISGTTRLVSVGVDGEPADADTYGSSFSADGRYLVVGSDAHNLIDGDTNRDYSDVFVCDLTTGLFQRASVGDAGQQGRESSYGGGISADGRHVVFSSYAGNLITGASGGPRPLIYVRDQ